MKIPGDNSSSKKIDLLTDGNAARKAGEQAKVSSADSDAVKTSLGKVLSQVEVAERRQKILELKTRHDNGTLQYDSNAVAEKIAETIDEEIALENQS